MTKAIMAVCNACASNCMVTAIEHLPTCDDAEWVTIRVVQLEDSS